MTIEDEQGSGPEGDQALVAEYALGLLGPAEHDQVARRIAAEPVLAAELRLWQLRFSSLDAEFAETPAPAGALARLETRLFPGAKTAPSRWWDSLALWRGLAAAGLAVAVVSVGFSLAQPRFDADQVATQLVAALQSQEGSGVSFVAFYDTERKTVRLVGTQGQAVPDKDYELWYIKGDQPAVSMGVVPVDHPTQIPLDSKAQANFEPGTVLAVTLEAKGGSPTGVAQGPIVAVGKATPI